ncbi:hypothetical protein HC248_03381 [Polaromonas vacuolata]|uniref:MSHA biogenesis protein MshK n=1 Tax=Polaromonas vacuolata TaxID=37448 RepID=A0A6H2HEN6_9BURK|nr:hypothetical protein [Polaromonas vacuolata]QJC58044.1 hypothetical protein HC248_03381 [Polaromonas vacuolata]
MMALRRFFHLLMLLTLLVGQAQAQSLRDPTQPPQLLTPITQSGGMSSASANPQLVPNGISLVVRQGKTYLVFGNRLYAEGQQIGAARIEHITETEVWWREAGVLHKQQIFPGIERRTAEPVPARSACRLGQSSRIVSDAAGVAGTPYTPDDFCHKAQP